MCGGGGGDNLPPPPVLSTDDSNSKCLMTTSQFFFWSYKYNLCKFSPFTDFVTLFIIFVKVVTSLSDPVLEKKFTFHFYEVKFFTL